jgi:hypothetical protein
MSYDPKCYDLACVFLEDVGPIQNIEKARDQFAQSIQNTIEGFLSHLEDADEISK